MQYISVLKGDPTCFKQPMSILQPVNVVDIDMSENMTSSESNPVQEMEVRIESTRHVFAFTDDGSVKLMEVPRSKET